MSLLRLLRLIPGLRQKTFRRQEHIVVFGGAVVDVLEQVVGNVGPHINHCNSKSTMTITNWMFVFRSARIIPIMPKKPVSRRFIPKNAIITVSWRFAPRSARIITSWRFILRSAMITISWKFIPRSAVTTISRRFVLRSALITISRRRFPRSANITIGWRLTTRRKLRRVSRTWREAEDGDKLVGIGVEAEDLTDPKGDLLTCSCRATAYLLEQMCLITT